MNTTPKKEQSVTENQSLENHKDLDKLRKPKTIIKMLLTIPVLFLFARVTEQIIRRTKNGRVRIFQRKHFAFEADLEANWQTIRKELDALLEDWEGIPRFRQIHKSLTVVEKWKSHMFYGYGNKIQRNCDVCPETTRLIEKVPYLNTAMFSILPPNTKLPPHTGIYNGILRYHLGLRIPQPIDSCGFRVEDEIIHWKEGEGFVFDNRYEHEAWNNSNEIRVVLFLDFLRPLPNFVARMNRRVTHMISKAQFVKEGLKNIEDFYRKK